MKQLLFVYNANSDLFSSVSGFAHKIISPSTYQCSLCALTYGNLTVKQEWENFIKQLSFAVVFLYKDEFEKLYSLQTQLPAVFIKEDETIQEIISAREINDCKSLDELKKLIEQKLESLSFSDMPDEPQLI